MVKVLMLNAGQCGHVLSSIEHQTNAEDYAMKNVTRHIGTLHKIKRLKNSVYGNPQFLLYVDETGSGHGFSFRTPANSSIAYEIENYLGKAVEATIGTHYGCSTLNTIKEI